MSVVVVTTVELDEKALAAMAKPGEQIHIVVLAVELSRLQWITNAEDEPRAEADGMARRMADDVANPATAHETPDTPSLAVLDAVREHRPDRVVVVIPEGEGSWLVQGAKGEIPASVEGVPVERRSL